MKASFVELCCLVLLLLVAVTGCDKLPNSDAVDAVASTEVNSDNDSDVVVATAIRTKSQPDTARPTDSAPRPEPAKPDESEGQGVPSDKTSPAACSDGKDNDGDGLTDWQYDLGCYGPDDDTEGGLKTRELDNGWSVFEPSKDTRVIYVSSSVGNDANSGASPSRPKKTLSAALKAARKGHPDWVLLARGDTWNESLPLREGRSRSEPLVVASYGESTERPLLQTGSEVGLKRPGPHFNNFAVVGIAFYAHTRDPKSPAYVDATGHSGFDFSSKTGATGQGILLEDCWFNFYTGNVIQGNGLNKDIVLRRNIFTNNYSPTSHSQGLYSSNASILLEENIFDHNGWYRQQTGAERDKTDGQATIYNHNTYFVDQKATTFRRNVFLRPSSMCNKWTANSGAASAREITIDNNLYVDCEVGIGIGGNDKVTPYRFKNVTISNNVFLDMGRSRPTNRELGWYLNINDWDGGKVSKNLFLHQPSKTVTNVHAIKIRGDTKDVVVENNVVYGLRSSGALVILTEGAIKHNIAFINNQLQSQTYEAVLLSTAGAPTNYRFTGNTYHSNLATKRWFEIGNAHGDLAAWKNASGATGEAMKFAFPDPTRSIETYQKALGKTPTIEAFIAEMLTQSKYNWRVEYTAAAVNEWIRAGFMH